MAQVYDQEQDRAPDGEGAFESRGYREAATLLTELGLWDCGAPAEVLIGVVAAAWLKGVRDGMVDVVGGAWPISAG